MSRVRATGAGVFVHAGDVLGEVQDSTRLDRYLAIAAGPASWRDDRRPTTADLTAGCLELAALGGVLTVTLTAASHRHGLGARWVPFVLVAAMAAVLLAVAGPTARWVFGPDRHSRRRRLVDLRVVAACRTVGFAAAVALWAIVVGGSHVQDAWMFGVAGGCEATLGARTIGAPNHAWQWWRRVVAGPAHVLLALAAIAVGVSIGGSDGLVAGVATYFALQIAAFVAALQAWELERIRRHHVAELRDHAESAERHRHRQRAHWLHDDVCSELRLLRLQLETRQIEPGDVPDRLDELDHRLRIRQLDELLRSGRVRLAEVIQPFVRRAQAHGLTVREVPRFEQASLELDEHTGRMVQRTAAVLMTNSIQAGASVIGIRATIEPDSGRFALEFDDDAGGFDIVALPPGRGLDSLRHELGPETLELRRTDTGTCARVVFALPAREEVR
jgi:hypothetical protein